MRNTMRRLAVASAVSAAFLAFVAGPAFAAAPPPTPTPGPGVQQGLPDPGAKATAPQTDLKNYPKGSGQSQPAPKPGQSNPTTDIVSISAPDADGSTRIRIYDPIPGSDPEKVAANLRAAGDKNARVVTNAARTSSGGIHTNVADPNECIYGYAVAENFGQEYTGPYQCPKPFFWANEGFDNPHVRFNDHTGSAWPTDKAVYDWNTANGINSYYLYNQCPFQAGARCVDVNNYNKADGLGGYNDLQVNIPDHTYQDNKIKVWLNNYYANLNHYTAADYRHVVEHEMGHALGLGHSGDETGSCMAGPKGLKGDADDFAFLAGLYQINRP